jgi:hypothetical protein
MKNFLLSILIGFFAVNTSSAQNKSYNLNDAPVSNYKEISISKSNSDSTFKNATRLRELVINPIVQNTELIRVNDTILLDLFNNKQYKACIDKIDVDVNGTLIIRARLVDYNYGYCIISTSNGKSFITIDVPENNDLFMSRYNHQANKYYLLQIDKSKQKELEGSPSLIPPTDNQLNDNSKKKNQDDSPDHKPYKNATINSENTANDSVILNDEYNPDIITLLIVYTPAAAAWASANETNINNTISLLMARAQLALDNSNTLLSIQLVHSEQVNYTELNTDDDLYNLTNTADGFMDNVHSLRDTYCADLVILLENIDFTGGLGWLLNSTSGNPTHAFSLSRVQQASWTYTTIHEIGHNMGCHHHKLQNVQPGPGLYTYSAGWRWTGTDNGQYCSIMTYESGTYFADGITHTRVAYFSNPGIQYKGAATGDATDADNAKNIRKIKSVVAAYRVGCCTLPTTQASAFTSSAITNTTMTIGWTRGNGNAVLVVAKAGSAVNADPVSGTTYTANAAFGSGTQIGTGNYVVYDGTATSMNISALTAGTIYHYAIYEYNSAGYCYKTLALTGNATTTGTPPCTYCASSGSTDYNTGITSVNFNTINNVTGKPAAYNDYTGLSTTVNKNSTYNLTVKLNTDGNYTIHAFAWIDWNQDCDFLDANEVYDLGTAINVMNGATTLSPLSIIIPASALTGSTRMRVSTEYGANPTSCDINFDGEVEDYSINVNASACTPPTASTANAATNISQTSFTASWSSSATAAAYRLDVATNIGFTTFVTGFNDKDVSNVTTCSVTGLSSNTSYYYRVRAYNSCGTSTNSGTITATTLPNPPPAPSANQATNILQTSFTANWSSSVTATGYRLDVATNIGFTTFVTGYNDKDVSNVTNYSITGLSPKTLYYYRGRAYNTGGTSTNSGTITLKTLTNPSSVPSGMTASSCNDLVTINWGKSTGSDFFRYRIYGGTSNNPTTKIDSTTNGISDTSKVIYGLTRGQTYYFRVTSVNYDGPESNFSNQSTATVKTGVVPKIRAKWGDVLICSNLGDSIKSYQWYKGSSIISNAVAQYYITKKIPDSYKVETIDKNGCKNSSNLISISGTKSLSGYPNPASVSFVLKLNDESESRAVVSIFNSAGIKVMEFNTENLNDEPLKEIPVNNLDEGIYVVQVLLNHKDLYYTKIVVIK